MLQLVAGWEPGICELAGQAEEVVSRGKSQVRKPEKTPSCRSNCARLDKLQHVLHSGADRSVGAADTSVRATPGPTGHSRRQPTPGGEPSSPWQE